MVWVPVESSDVAAIGWEASPIEEEEGVGMMGVQFHRPPGSMYYYYDVPRDIFDEFMAAPSKGRYVNLVLKRSGLAYERVT
jgi:KTSC domain